MEIITVVMKKAAIYGEIQQGRRLPPHEELLITLERTADVVRHALDRELRRWGISAEQYNALRILQGAPEGCHPTLEIADRMIARCPNITRMIDKLVRKGLVRRERCTRDRRVVWIRIADQGRRVLRESTAGVKAVVAKACCVSAGQARAMIAGMDSIRACVAVCTSREKGAKP
jgi:DNA-binding MarR family transcriptional regulator